MVATLAGCRKQAPVSFTHWGPTEHAAGGSSAAFTKLVAAGEEVERRARAAALPDSKGRPTTPVTARTTFFPKQRSEAREVVGQSRSAALAAATDVINFDYTPVGLNPPPAYLGGLRLIGFTLIWDIDEAITNQDYDKAIVGCGSATRLGFALMGGGAFEASLGASLINQARLKMVPYLGSLNALQLGKLGAALQKASLNRPAMQVSVENERDNMLLTLQQAQDMFAENKLDRLLEKLGSSAKDQVDQLQALESDQAKGKELFDWIGNDITTRTEWYLKKVKNPRKVGLPPKLEDKRQYRMLYRYFGSNIENLVPLLQSTYCRTQLFILECYLKQKQKMQRELPTSLRAFSRSAILDPFTGEPFYYKSGDSSYILYSAGEDGIDNGGMTDTSFRYPDMLLEKPHS